MTDDAELLASAYLDNEATADERVRVESDPELLAEVERLQAVREQLSAPEPAAISRRENHLATALAAWDRLPDAERLGTRDDSRGGDATTVAAASAMSRPPRDRSRQRWLLGAAAALVVVVGAGVVLQQIDPTDNDDTVAEPASAADDEGGDAATEESAEESADVDEGAEAPAGPEEAAETEIGESEPAEELTASDIEAESRALEAIEEEGGSTDELSHSADTPEQGPPGDEAADELPVLATQADLIAFASPALTVTETTIPFEDLIEEDSGISPTTIAPECTGYGIDLLVGLAVYSDRVVMVGVDRDDGNAIAYDPTDCALVESLPIPD